MNETTTLGEILGNSLFVDGDWVESKDQDPDGDVRLIQLADIGDGRYLNKSSRFLTSAKARDLRCTFLNPGDILVARMPEPLGRACIWPGDSKDSVTVVDVCIIRPDPRRVSSRWLMHYLNSDNARFQVLSMATGTTRTRISRKNLGKLRLSMPILSEQIRVAQVLDHVDSLRTRRREAVTLLDDLAQSIFLDMFGETPKVPTSNLGDHLTFMTSGGRGWAKYYSDEGERFIRSLDVRMNRIDDGEAVFVKPPSNAEARRTEVHTDDILLTITGSLIGRVAAASASYKGSYISQHVAILRPDENTFRSEFLAFYLSLPFGGQRQIAQMQYGQTKPGLNFEQIRKFQVPVPEISMQEEFLRRLNAIKGLRFMHEMHVAELDKLFASLQQRAFRGDLWEH